ncbi:MAG: DUF3307 domain-containing protein [Glaciecola sp.]
MIDLATIFGCLLVVHILADFYLQPHSWIMSKVKYKEKSLGLAKHMLVHTLLTFLALLVATQGVSHNSIIALLIIILTHYAIDIWKTYMGFTIAYFLCDQIGHIIVLLGVSIWLSNTSVFVLSQQLITSVSFNHVVWGVGYLLVYKPMAITIQLLLRPYLQDVENVNHANSGLQMAGEHIGSLERIIVLTFVLLEQYSGIGFLLAAKSVFRFGDMRRQQDRKLTEYIMLGTLLSVSGAMLVGVLINRITA